MSLSIVFHTPLVFQCFFNLPQGVCGIQLELRIALSVRRHTCIMHLRTAHVQHLLQYHYFAIRITDLNTWIAGSHGFAYSSMRATGNTSAAILLQSKHLVDTLTSTHISA